MGDLVRAVAVLRSGKALSACMGVLTEAAKKNGIADEEGIEILDI